jgi:hypothetical protein
MQQIDPLESAADIIENTLGIGERKAGKTSPPLDKSAPQTPPAGTLARNPRHQKSNQGPNLTNIV